MKKFHSVFCFVIGAALAGLPMQEIRAAGTFSIVVLPDTQYYSASWPDTYRAQAQWVCSAKSARNILFVAHEGDIVDNRKSAQQWQNADAAQRIIDTCGIPNGVLAGNHDGIPASDNLMMQFFGPDRPWPAGGTHGTQPWWCGWAEYRTTGRMLASCQLVPETNWIVFEVFYLGDTGMLGATSLDDDRDDKGRVPSDKQALRFVHDTLSRYPGREAILVTHADLLNPTSATPEGKRQSGYDEIFNLAILPEPRIRLVLSGHQIGRQAEARRTTMRPDGSVVHELLANYQSRANGGDGWLRILTIDPTTRSMQVETYSPTLDQFETDSNSYFTLSLGDPRDINQASRARTVPVKPSAPKNLHVIPPP